MSKLSTITFYDKDSKQLLALTYGTQNVVIHDGSLSEDVLNELLRNGVTAIVSPKNSSRCEIIKH